MTLCNVSSVILVAVGSEKLSGTKVVTQHELPHRQYEKEKFAAWQQKGDALFSEEPTGTERARQSPALTTLGRFQIQTCQ